MQVLQLYSQRNCSAPIPFSPQRYGEHCAKLLITYSIGKITDTKKVPIIVSPSNSVEITGVGAKLYIPNEATMIYDDEDFEEEPDFEKSSRCTKSHDMDNFSEKMTSAGKRVSFYFTSKKSSALKNSDGEVFTIYMDCSKLPPGEYDIETKDNEAVTTTDKKQLDFL